MASIDVKLADDPTVKRIVQTAFPNYRKRTAWIRVWSGSQNINSYWDGGSRDEYAIVELATMTRRPMPTVGHPYFEVKAQGVPTGSDSFVEVDHVGNVTLKILPAGYVLVQAGTFCGKPATARIIANPADMPKYLTTGAEVA